MSDQTNCLAELHFGDDYGDNRCTVRCQLPVAHELPHCETFTRGGLPVVITWHGDDRGDAREYDQGDIGMTAARERMTQERLNELTFPVGSSSYLDIELPDDQVHEAVLLADALAYGADERATAMLEAAKAICPGWCGHNKKPEYVTVEDVGKLEDQGWVHRWSPRVNPPAIFPCPAGPIHDAIQAVRGGGSTNATT